MVKKQCCRAGSYAFLVHNFWCITILHHVAPFLVHYQFAPFLVHYHVAPFLLHQGSAFFSAPTLLLKVPVGSLRNGAAGGAQSVA